jgi:hypothetical protein
MTSAATSGIAGSAGPAQGAGVTAADPATGVPGTAWPDLAWQVAYADLAWALVLAAALCALLDGVLAARPPGSAASRRLRDGLVVVALVVVSFLPGGASLFDALGLALQQPSGLLTALATVALARRLARPDRRAAALPPGWAIVIVAAGTLLYIDTVGWTSWQLYRLGMPGVGTASLALTVLALVALLGVALDRGQAATSMATGPALALLAALVLHAVLRLPTGNLWDALLDPVLWGWALVVVATRGVGVAMRALRRKADGVGLS